LATWSFLSLSVVGPKSAVCAFDRTALGLPVFSEYTTSRKGKKVTDVLLEDMVVESPVRWGRWWYSQYRLQIKYHDETVEVVEKASRDHPRLCFQLDVDTEHEEFQSFLLRRGRVRSMDFDAESVRVKAEEELSNRGEEVQEWELDELVLERIQEQMDLCWRSQMIRCLAAQSVRKRKPR